MSRPGHARIRRARPAPSDLCAPNHLANASFVHSGRSSRPRCTKLPNPKSFGAWRLLVVAVAQPDPRPGAEQQDSPVAASTKTRKRSTAGNLPGVSTRVATAFAPGRVNLIGEHTDYNDGLALAFSVRAGVTVSAVAGSGEQLEVIAHDLGARDTFSRREPGPASGWRAYVRGAVAELQEQGYRPSATRLEIRSDLAIGAGMFSSAALTVAVCLALIAQGGEQPPAATALARICQRVEARWAGAETGLLDQLTSLLGTADHVLLIDFLTLEAQTLALDLRGFELVLLPTGQARTNAASGYNERREQCREAAHRMRVESLRDATIQDLHMLPDTLARRARHVITENGRVLAATRALGDGDLTALGGLLDRSHASLRDDFEVSTDAVEAAVAELKAAGAVGARLMGGGFGGSVLALMPPGTVAPAGATVVSPGPGAHLIA